MSDENKVYYFVQTISTDNYYNPCRHAIIALSEEMFKELAKRRKLLLQRKEECADLMELVYNAGDEVSFYDYISHEPDDDALDIVLTQEQYRLVEDAFCCVLTKNQFEVFEKDEERVECCYLHVADNGVFWAAFPRHGSTRIETELLSYELLFGDKL